MAEVFCNQCGHRNALGANFCSSCGAPLEHEPGERTTITFAIEVPPEAPEDEVTFDMLEASFTHRGRASSALAFLLLLLPACRRSQPSTRGGPSRRHDAGRARPWRGGTRPSFEKWLEIPRRLLDPACLLRTACLLFFARLACMACLHGAKYH